MGPHLPILHGVARSLLPSLLLHGLLLIAMWAFTPTSAPSLLPPRSIDAEVLSEAQFGALTPPEASITPEALATGAPVAALQDDAVAATTAPDDVIRATRLFSSAILEDPANRQVREALPTLAPHDRVTQLCNIEALEQIRLAIVPVMPDSVAASAFADTSLSNFTLTAAGAAYRADRQWTHVAYTCALTPDLGRIVAFDLTLGTSVPESEWDSHDLIAEDEDE